MVMNGMLIGCVFCINRNQIYHEILNCKKIALSGKVALSKENVKLLVLLVRL